MLCGWGPECSFDKYGNATQAMLDQVTIYFERSHNLPTFKKQSEQNV